jgi:hypothetical protein
MNMLLQILQFIGFKKVDILFESMHLKKHSLNGFILQQNADNKNGEIFETENIQMSCLIQTVSVTNIKNYM